MTISSEAAAAGSEAVLIERHRSAMRRGSLSRPLAAALAHGVLQPGRSIFDFGCGRGDDVARLRAMGFQAGGWDPAWNPAQERWPADVVNLGYVVNVIENQAERTETLREAWRLATFALVVAGRMVWESNALQGVEHGDGVVTKRRTFQKLFTQDELRSWIGASLGEAAVAAEPGIFYVFRMAEDAQRFLSSRVRRQVSVPSIPASAELFRAHQEVLEPLLGFLAQRGRLPRLEELAATTDIVARFGSIRAAYAVVRRATGTEQWDQIAAERRNDLLVYLALAVFGGRPRASALPEELQLDVRDFFGSYKTACTQADRLLFGAGDLGAVDVACRAALVGKATPEALYVHESAVGRLPALLRVYEGCGRQLAGTVEGANVVKLNRRQAKVSYLAYPRFDAEPHPTLARSTLASLGALSLNVYDYSRSDNPPILHRKEALVAGDYPLRERFVRLTVQEERLGLYEHAETIGTRLGWDAALGRTGLEQRGHRIVRRRNKE